MVQIGVGNPGKVPNQRPGPALDRVATSVIGWRITPDGGWQQDEDPATMSVNHIVLLGRVDQVPELRYTPEGQAVTRIVLHVDRPDGTGSDAIRVIARRELAESVVDLLVRNDLATVEGRVLLRTYQTKEGHRHKVAEVEADRIQRVVLPTVHHG